MPATPAKNSNVTKEAVSLSAANGTKRTAEESELFTSKKAKIEAPTPKAQASLGVEPGSDKEDEEEEEGSEVLSDEVQNRLVYLTDLVQGLTKSYLKDVMKGLSGFYGRRSGTNREMAAEIVGHLEDCARNGDDLADEERLIEKVDRICYGGCAGDSEDENEW